MPREYSCSFTKVTVSAAQDLFQVKGASGKVVRIMRIGLAEVDTSPAAAQMFELRCSILTATVSDGSGGSTVTPRPFDIGDAAASFTCLINNTTPASSGTSKTTIHSDGVHNFSGYSFSFAKPPIIMNGESFVFELLSTVSGTVNLSGTVDAEESGG